MQKWAHTTQHFPLSIAATMTEESLLSRLVWYRSHSTSDALLWIPAVYYTSHREGIPALGGLAALKDDPVLQRTLTMQLIQEQIQAASVPLVRLLLPTDNSAAEEANALQVRTVHDTDNVELEMDFVKHMIYLCDESNASSHVYRTQLQHVYQLLRQEEGEDGKSEPVVKSQSTRSNEAKPFAKTKEDEPLEIEEDEEDIVVNNEEKEEIEAWNNEEEPMNDDEEEEDSEEVPSNTMRRVSVSVRKPQPKKLAHYSSSSVTPPYQPLLSVRAKRNSSSALLTQEEAPHNRDHRKKPKPSNRDLQTPQPNPRKGNNNQKKVPSPHWWKRNAIPTTEQVQPILQLLGFKYDTDTQRYSLPLPSAQKWTMGLTGLRKFLCCYGIPNYTTTQSRLSLRQQERLRRWLVFANVPCQTKEDARRLRTLSSPKKTDQLLSQLYNLGFSTVDGKLYVPEYKQMHDYQGRPAHGQHYFHLERELSSQVRVYIRGAWRLGVVTEPPTSDEVSPKYRDTLLPVRLWAAASSQPLPVFRFLPDDDYLRPYTQMPNDVEPEEEESDSEEEEEAENIKSSDEDSVQITKVIPSPATSVASSTDDDTASSMENDDSPLWFLRTALPDFTKVIWPVLQKKLGFFFRSGAYGHPDAFEGRAIGNSKDLQAFCAEHGIPNYDDAGLVDSERRALYRWATFAHVPVPPSQSVVTFRDTPLLTDRQVCDLLKSQQFTFLGGGGIVPPPGGLDSTPAQFASLEELRVFMRGAADVLRRRTPQLVALRMWAARSTAPLPTFVPTASLNKDDSDDESMEEEEPQELLNVSPEEEEDELFEEPLGDQPEQNMDDEEEKRSYSLPIPERKEVQNAPTTLFPNATTPECSSTDDPNAFFSCEQPVELHGEDDVPKSSEDHEDDDDAPMVSPPNKVHVAAVPTKLVFLGSPSEHDQPMPNITELTETNAAPVADLDTFAGTLNAPDPHIVNPAPKRRSPTVSVLETIGCDQDDDDSMVDTDDESWKQGFSSLATPGFATQYDTTDDDVDEPDEGMDDDGWSPEEEGLPPPQPHALTTQPELDAEEASEYEDFGF
jgi:hypothetical protein